MHNHTSKEGIIQLFSVFGVDFDVFSAFLICMKKSLLSSGAIPQPLSEAVQGGEDQARGNSWLFPYGRLKYKKFKYKIS